MSRWCVIERPHGTRQQLQLTAAWSECLVLAKASSTHALEGVSSKVFITLWPVRLVQLHHLEPSEYEGDELF